MTGGPVIGATTFNPERFNVAREMGYRGWAIWADGDMLCRTDIDEVMAYADPYCDVVVAKHDYKTKHPVKFLGQPNHDYPRKNWSSVMLINCGNAAWHRLAVGHSQKDGQPYTLQDLHRFKFVDEDRIGALPLEWNWLVSEYAFNQAAKLVHFTIGSPCWREYADCDYADEWHEESARMTGFATRLPEVRAA